MYFCFSLNNVRWLAFNALVFLPMMCAILSADIGLKAHSQIITGHKASFLALGVSSLIAFFRASGRSSVLTLNSLVFKLKSPVFDAKSLALKTMSSHILCDVSSDVSYSHEQFIGFVSKRLKAKAFIKTSNPIFRIHQHQRKTNGFTGIE